MAAKPSRGRKRAQRDAAGSARSGPAAEHATKVTVRRADGEDAWELVHPRCARKRHDDLEEVGQMLDAGEVDVARDECRWLLQGCSDCLDAHRLLGEIALAEDDLPLARGHFGYAYRLGTSALDRADVVGPLPYRLPANQGFHTAGKALAWCLVQLGKREMAAEVVERLLACDPDDPLGVGSVMGGK